MDGHPSSCKEFVPHLILPHIGSSCILAAFFCGKALYRPFHKAIILQFSLESYCNFP